MTGSAIDKIETIAADFCYIFDPKILQNSYFDTNIEQKTITAKYDGGVNQNYEISCTISNTPPSLPMFDFIPKVDGADRVSLTFYLENVKFKYNGIDVKSDDYPTLIVTNSFCWADVAERVPNNILGSLALHSGETGLGLMPHQLIRYFMATTYGGTAVIVSEATPKNLLGGFAKCIENYLAKNTILDISKITGNPSNEQANGAFAPEVKLEYPTYFDFGAGVAVGANAVSPLIVMFSYVEQISSTRNHIITYDLCNKDGTQNGWLVLNKGFFAWNSCRLLSTGGVVYDKENNKWYDNETNFGKFLHLCMNHDWNSDQDKNYFTYQVDTRANTDFQPNFRPPKDNYVEFLNHSYNQSRGSATWWSGLTTYFFTWKTDNNISVAYYDTLGVRPGYNTLSISGTSTFNGTLQINDAPTNKFDNKDQSKQPPPLWDFFRFNCSFESYYGAAKQTGIAMVIDYDGLTTGIAHIPSKTESSGNWRWSVKDGNMVDYLHGISNYEYLMKQPKESTVLFAIQLPIPAVSLGAEKYEQTAVTIGDLRIAQNTNLVGTLSVDTSFIPRDA